MPHTIPEVITAVPIAFKADGRVDYEGSRAVLRYVARSGNDGAFILGSTGEFPALSLDERRVLVELSLRELAPHMRVVVHVGAASLFEVDALITQARDAGASEIAVITPYFLPATEDAVFGFFADVSARCDGLRVFVYVYRVRTGIAVSDDLMARISRLPNIVGAKVSEESLERIAAYRAVVPSDFLLYTGSDGELSSVERFGVQGVVSGISSVLPLPFRALADALGSGDAAAIAAAEADVKQVVGLLAGDLARIKTALGLLDVDAGVTRMLTVQPSPDVVAQIQRAVTSHSQRKASA